MARPAISKEMIRMGKAINEDRVCWASYTVKKKWYHTGMLMSSVVRRAIVQKKLDSHWNVNKNL